MERPDTPLARSALLTGTRLDPSLGSQLKKEIATADRVDILCSFIKWSGLRVLLDDLKTLAEENGGNGPRIRIITTSYMGATDPRAIEQLSQLPNTEIRVSYDTKRTRLHAKAYLFHRQTGFSSAYVGSANISNAALSEGLEWTTKISHYELPYLWEKIAGTFETYWEDEEFQLYSPETQDQLRQAINRERNVTVEGEVDLSFDIRPFPFQEEILDVLAVERNNHQKYRQLVVAATGTGKTMIAAFDYARLCKEAGEKIPILFIVHREEILKQAMGTFRVILRDQNFGDLLVGGREPEQNQHLFCSIQSYNSRGLSQLVSHHFQYVVVDEFHHAAAASYRKLLEHVQPKYLLGLTATPERGDLQDVYQWFGGAASAEVRLPDAINRRLLCPFQYFGVTDSEDLDGLDWQRGGYRKEELDRLYTGNDVRAQLVVDKVKEIVLAPQLCRCLGFCVSVAHAEYMAEYFSRQSLSAIALTAQSTNEERRSAIDRLRAKKINFIFVVDLYNEGVDIPEVDTVLFLRPTESLTIFLQQLGRGLRLHEEKECLTVLDFIGAQRREYRYASRFRALSSMPTSRLDNEIENGFPHLPNGCVVKLERVAQQRVLENIQDSVRLLRPRVINQIRELGRALGRRPAIGETLNYLDTSLGELLKRGLWSRLLKEADLIEHVEAPHENRLAKGLFRLSHVECTYQLEEWKKLLNGENGNPKCDETLEQMLHVSLWGTQGTGWSKHISTEKLKENPTVINDLRSILDYRLSHTLLSTTNRYPQLSGPLTVHAPYTRDEILVGLGHWTLKERPRFTEGVLHLKNSKVDAFFVTLQKTEQDYSPTTMYEDYLISHDKFHWQSQSNTSVESPTGQRYINHRKETYTPLLFVRETKKTPSGQSAPYYYLGPCEYFSHHGSRPISIVWKLKHTVPARLFRVMARQNIG